MDKKKIREIFEKEIKPLLPRQIKKIEKYYAIFEYMATNARAQSEDGIREAELPKELLPAKHQLNILGKNNINAIKIIKPIGSNKSWYDKVNIQIYPKWKWNESFKDYKSRMQQHMEDDPEVASIVSEILGIPESKAKEEVVNIDNLEDYNPIVEKLVERQIAVSDYVYGPLEWRRNPFHYKLSDFFCKLIGGN